MNLGRIQQLSLSGNPALVDRLIVVGLITAGLVQSWPDYFPVSERWAQADWFNYLGPFVVSVAVALPLLARRTRPIAVLAAVGVCLFVASFMVRDPSTPPFAVFLAVYSIGRYGRSRTQSAAAIALAVGVAAIGTQLSGGIDPWFGFLAATIVGLYEVGSAARSHEIRTQELEERDARHVAEREAQAARAADEERGRIARELHDVIAHNVSVMVVQAAAAGRIVDRDPIEARRSLEAIESTGRQALAEMRRLLGVLRRDDEPLLSDPQPSLARLPRLIEEMRASGLPADLSIEGVVRTLPAGVDLSAYRVVQEALTNALRHAGGSPTRVLLRYGESTIELEVVDGGRAGSEAATIGHGGHGISGMRERVALVRGELEAGPRPEGGFRIWARLPIESPTG